MSAELVIAALNEAWEKFPNFPKEQQPEIARWVKRRVDGVRAGVPAMQKTAEPSAAPNWYEREPGEEG